MQFWVQLWDNPAKYNKNAAWIKEVDKNNEENKLKGFVVTAEMMEKRTWEIKNC